MSLAVATVNLLSLVQKLNKNPQLRGVQRMSRQTNCDRLQDLPLPQTLQAYAT